ncbi:MAG: hypothetical protein INR62_08915 [Rhodospirillales bacterium]|nr:hypothetical protein [Acetobacter sp.]
MNTPSHIYHYSSSRWYGHTAHGKYLSEAEALAEGDRAARNEHHPKSPAIPPPPPADSLPASEAIAAEAAAFTTPPSTELLSTCVTAIAAQSDPAKLTTLGSRAANPRLKRILYYLAQARAGGTEPGEVIDRAQKQNGSYGTPRAPLVKVSLLRNLKICDGLRMLTPENLASLRRGGAPTVMRGPYAGQKAEVDHIVPLAVVWNLGNELANLELLPASLNRGKSAKVGERQLDLARKFQNAGLITEEELAAVKVAFRPAGTEKYQLSE